MFVDILFIKMFLLYCFMKQDRGTIMIRLRVEWKSESEARKLAFKLPPRFLINVKNQKAFDVLRYICRGKVSRMTLDCLCEINWIVCGTVNEVSASFLNAATRTGCLAGQYGTGIVGLSKVLCQ